MPRQKQLDFTESEINTILNGDPAADKTLAKEFSTTIASIKAMRRYMGKPKVKAAAKIPNPIKTRGVDAPLDEIRYTTVKFDGGFIVMDKNKVLGIEVKSDAITIAF